MTSELNDTTAAGPPEPRRSRRFWRRLFWIFIVFIIGALLLIHFQGKRKPAQASGPPPTMPVVAVSARKGDLPIYLNGLGSAVAMYTVTVRTRVDGELFRVPVREGQM